MLSKQFDVEEGLLLIASYVRCVVRGNSVLAVPSLSGVLCSYISASKVLIKSVSPQVGLSTKFKLYTREMKWIPPSKT